MALLLIHQADDFSQIRVLVDLRQIGSRDLSNLDAAPSRTWNLCDFPQ
jgi:hypothetical protein